jgi:Pyridoxamine 5'-phosphate oxidase
MGQRFTEIKDSLREFIEAQKIFFVATAAADGRVNVSPKGMDSLRVLDRNRIVWLNVTGSGNETAAHLQELPRMTLMFCAFTGSALILRVYGAARMIVPASTEWSELYALFTSNPGARQLVELKVDLVQTSCGQAVPFFDYVSEREELNDWAAKKGEAGIKQYQSDRNAVSIDGKVIS